MKTVKGRRTKTRILDAAVELLVSGGAAKLSLDAVSERSQTSKGQLFYYFPGGRAELLKAATVSQLDVIAAQGTPDALLTWDDWEEWFERLATVHIAQSAEDACEVAALAGRTLDADADGRLLIGRVFDDWHRALGGWFTSMQAYGLLRDDAPLDQLASLVLATIEGSAVLDKATGSTRHLGAALGQVLVVLRSYGPTTTTEP